MKKFICVIAMWLLSMVANATTLLEIEKTISELQTKPGIVTGFVFKDEGELAYLSAQDGIMHVSPMVLYLPIEVVEFVLHHEYAHAVLKHNDDIRISEASVAANKVKALRHSMELMADDYAIKKLLSKQLSITPVIEFFDRLNTEETLSHPSAQKRIEHIKKML